MTASDVLTPLTLLEFALDQADFETVHAAPGEVDGQPFEQLAVVLAAEFSVRLAFVNDMVRGLLAGQRVPAPPEQLIVLQFLLALPDPIGARPLDELAQLVNQANQRIPFGAFLLDPGQGVVFRYNLACESRQVPPLIVAEAIEVIQTYLPHPIAPLRDYLAGRSDYAATRRSLDN